MKHHKCLPINCLAELMKLFPQRGRLQVSKYLSRWLLNKIRHLRPEVDSHRSDNSHLLAWRKHRTFLKNLTSKTMTCQTFSTWQTSSLRSFRNLLARQRLKWPLRGKLVDTNAKKSSTIGRSPSFLPSSTHLCSSLMQGKLIQIWATLCWLMTIKSLTMSATILQERSSAWTTTLQTTAQGYSR